MANDSDKKRKLDDDNESLVKALESIKTLLATSEDKLNKARASIDQAGRHAMRDDQDVPVLDNIILPGKTAETPAVQENTEKLDLNAELIKSTQQADRLIRQMKQAPQPAEPDGLDKASLAALRHELETEMQEQLAEFTARLEEDLKTKIQIYLEQLARRKK
ncbi:MAG: hypothetical protein OEZ39_03535 [Gammaproteobacteria bacterium]|nr:hypothetical protein [Gammaproteobacteria bacterium]MDH5650928.1 hypothetical protein [Gammaproteobacteria bacterium]